jgi:hypothetical protein
MLLSIRPLMDMTGLSMDRLVVSPTFLWRYISIIFIHKQVHRHVYAREVYLPMEGACQDPVYNTWQILHMRKLLMAKVSKPLPCKIILLS